MALLGLVIGWVLTVFVGALGGLILWKVFKNEIDLRYIISDEDGDASLSRFQFLIFTFVVSISLFYIIVNQVPPGYPQNIPNQILALLGISGGSYVLSKGIQSSRDVGIREVESGPAPTVVVAQPQAQPAAAQPTVVVANNPQS